nr:hypothetical protein [Tanacetum cinerariifolium]
TALSVVPTSLSFLKAPVDKVPVLRVQHQTALSAVLTSLSFLKAPVDKVPVLRVQHQDPREYPGYRSRVRGTLLLVLIVLRSVIQSLLVLSLAFT